MFCSVNVYVYMEFCASSECNKCKANKFPHYLSVFRIKNGPISGCPILLMQKNLILCRFKKWMESMFLDQDVDAVSLANNCIIIWCYVGRNYNKIVMEMGMLTDNIRVTKNGLGSCVDRMFKSSGSAFYHITDRLNPFGKSVEFDFFFLGPVPGIRFTCIHNHIKVLMPWKWDRFPEFLAFA